MSEVHASHEKIVFNNHRPNLSNVVLHLCQQKEALRCAQDGIQNVVLHTSLPGNHRELEPPDPIPNSVVKWFIADGSVGFPHVRVGHRQASK